MQPGYLGKPGEEQDWNMLLSIWAWLYLIYRRSGCKKVDKNRAFLDHRAQIFSENFLVFFWLNWLVVLWDRSAQMASKVKMSVWCCPAAVLSMYSSFRAPKTGSRRFQQSGGAKKKSFCFSTPSLPLILNPLLSPACLPFFHDWVRGGRQPFSPRPLFSPKGGTFWPKCIFRRLLFSRTLSVFRRKFVKKSEIWPCLETCLRRGG